MKNAIIFHGTGCSPTSFWYLCVKQELEKKGYEVWIPALPDTDNQPYKEFPLLVKLIEAYE